MRAKITVVVTLATIVYAILGGVAFHYIEKGYESDTLPLVLEEFSIYTAADVNGMRCMNWTDLLLLKSILKEMSDSGLYISQSTGQLVNLTRWDIRTSIFAAVSVFASIGFPRLAPDFTGSHIFTVFYGWIGLPLFYCANLVLGKIMFKGMKFIARRIRLCCSKGKQQQQRSESLRILVAVYASFVIILSTLLILVPAIIFSHLEKWSYGESLYFCFSTFLTIGFGDYTPGFNRDILPSEEFLYWYRLATAFWVLLLVIFSMSQLSRLMILIDKSSEDSEAKIDEKLSNSKEMITDHLTSHHATAAKAGATATATAAATAAAAPWSKGTSITVNQDEATRRRIESTNEKAKMQGYDTNRLSVAAAGNPSTVEMSSNSGYVNIFSVGKT